MRDEILSYTEMVGRENRSLQKGMNFHVQPGYSILLMSVRKNAPYRDRWDDERSMLIYQGHDVPQQATGLDTKLINQELSYPTGVLTENGKFYRAGKMAARGNKTPEIIRVYEKLQRGIWSDKGLFLLVDADEEIENNRRTFIFMLRPVSDKEYIDNTNPSDDDMDHVELPHKRLIPTHVKVAVWKRDHGQCVICGSKDNLHFDHDIPFSKGGSSLTEANVRLLCMRHNLAKSDRIE